LNISSGDIRFPRDTGLMLSNLKYNIHWSTAVMEEEKRLRKGVYSIITIVIIMAQ